MSLRLRFQHAQPEPSSESRKLVSRIPSKAITPDGSKSSRLPQTASRSAKRVSRSNLPVPDIGAREAARTQVSVASTHNALDSSSRRLSTNLSTGTATAISSTARSYNGVLSPPPVMRTPSLISGGSSVSTFDSPKSHGLRRKPSGAIDRYAAQKHADSANLDIDARITRSGQGFYGDDYDDSVLGISLPPTMNHDERNELMNARGRMDGSTTLSKLIMPPTVLHASSTTPSTRFTDSPFSYAPTPSSASSYSPAAAAFVGANRLPVSSSPTQTRPSLSSRQDSKDVVPRSGLAPVRESSISSSRTPIRSTESKLPFAKKSTPGQPAASVATATSLNVQRTTSRKKLVKGQPALSSTKRPVQAPPELAHLSVDQSSPVKSPQKSPAPARPSRDGTPSLFDMTIPSPVVQSDLPRLYTTYHKRTPSQDTPLSADSQSARSRMAFSPMTPSSTLSPRIDSAISPPPAIRKLSRGATPEPQSAESAIPKRKDSPAVARTSPAKPRFGFFSRKSKTEPSKVAEKPKRQPTKGPTAGTGHEGYGRFGVQGRSGSMSSSTGLRSPSASSSTSSLPQFWSSRKGSTTSKDGSDMDDFLRERLAPVILRGSGSSANKPTSNPETSAIRTDAHSQTLKSLDNSTLPTLLPSAMQNVRPAFPAKPPALGQRKISDSSEDDTASRYPTLAAAAHPSRSAGPFRQGTASATRQVSNTNRNLASAPRFNDDLDIESSALSDTEGAPLQDAFALHEGQWFGSKKATRIPPVAEQKRNFSQHAQASPRSKGKERVIDIRNERRGILQISQPSLAAHYAFSDPVGPLDLYEVERMMQEIDTSAEESMSEASLSLKVVPYERRHAGLLPAPSQTRYGNPRLSTSRLPPPKITVHGQPSLDSSRSSSATRAPVHPAPYLSRNSDEPNSAELHPSANDILQQSAGDLQPVVTPEMRQGSFGTSPQGSKDSSPRQPRLSPVGRIPRVVSKRDRDRKLPDNSFSRPFVQAQPRPGVKPPGSVYNQIRNQIREMASPIESVPQMVVGKDLQQSLAPFDSILALRARNGLPVDRVSIEDYGVNEFFNIPQRKDSGQSFSSSSGYPSWTASVDISQPQQEDIWNEYNDFMDEVMPLRYSMALSSQGHSIQSGYPSYQSYQGSVRIPSMVGEPPSSELPLPPGFPTANTVLSVPQQVARFLQPSMSPLNPDRWSGISELCDDSGTSMISAEQLGAPRSRQPSIPQSTRFSLASARGSVSSCYSRASAHSRSASLPEINVRNSRSSFTAGTNLTRETQLLDIAEMGSTHDASAANLRVPALMTSKWLSFGRVLFSPAHNEMGLAEQPRVLVIDELSSDWSCFVAVSYPSATVYNLSTRTESPDHFEEQKPPGNHRQIRLTSLATPFPFPKGFFNAVVFRFPRATVEQTYQSLVSECKRVLRPGGFLEVAVLDLDLMNMGTEARRAVRELKTRMQQRDKGVCLRNMSDVLVRLIGRRGFEGVQRCVVGVPAAGRIPKSQDSSSVSSDSYSRPAWHAEHHSQPGQSLSFADLLEQSRTHQFGPEKGNDEHITKMVAKVGRWWYSSCYEKTLLPSDRSIWSDRVLLRECEKQGTSFRLLICHAQKPSQPRRRTVSV